jgi:hypothetical protein
LKDWENGITLRAIAEIFIVTAIYYGRDSGDSVDFHDFVDFGDLA